MVFPVRGLQYLVYTIKRARGSQIKEPLSRCIVYIIYVIIKVTSNQYVLSTSQV